MSGSALTRSCLCAASGSAPAPVTRLLGAEYLQVQHLKCRECGPVDVVQWVGCCLASHRVLGWIPSQSTCGPRVLEFLLKCVCCGPPTIFTRYTGVTLLFLVDGQQQKHFKKNLRTLLATPCWPWRRGAGGQRERLGSCHRDLKLVGRSCCCCCGW